MYRKHIRCKPALHMLHLYGILQQQDTARTDQESSLP